MQDQTGDVTIWIYDAVGNILQIVRGRLPDPNAAVGISGFTPAQGAAGTTVTVFGKGFGPTPAQNQLSFNGVAAPISAASPIQLLTRLPPGATSGPLSVTAPAGSATSAQAFTVLSAPLVSPAATALFPRQAQTFVATQPSQWRVNGLVGGGATVGTITPTGTTARYVAPAAVPPPGLVSITAAHQVDPSLQGVATVELLAAPTDPFPFRAPSLSVARQPGPVTAAPLAAPLLALARQPVVTAVEDPATGEPARFPRGATNQPLRLRGAGFTGVTGVAFHLGTSPDSAIVVNSFSVDSATQITATITINSGAPVGLRVVRVTAGGATSTAQGTGGNLLEVLP
jgi:hypothetical protein